jgi:MerR family transcriptional regulator, light-induced transcriptional regulator
MCTWSNLDHLFLDQRSLTRMPEPRYRIGAVARLAGVSAHVLRVWERRYGVPTPGRSEGGARLYSDAEVERVRLLKRAVDRGHAIGQIATLATAELERLAGGPTSMAAGRAETAGELLNEFVQAVTSLDAAQAERLLERARVLLSARELVVEVFAPLLTRIGRAWLKGELCTASEHLASALVREQVSQLLRQLPAEPGAELFLVSTPAAELHELGALLAAAIAKIHGYNVLYLGPNLPAAEIALAARMTLADVVALSIVALEPQAAAVELQTLVEALPAGVDLVLGGAQAHAANVIARCDLTLMSSLEELERYLMTRGRAVRLVRRATANEGPRLGSLDEPPALSAP